MQPANALQPLQPTPLQILQSSCMLLPQRQGTGLVRGNAELVTYITLVALARLGATAAASVTLDVPRQGQLPDCTAVHLLQAGFQSVHHVLTASLTLLLASATPTEHIKDVSHAPSTTATAAAHTLLDGVFTILHVLYPRVGTIKQGSKVSASSPYCIC